MNALKNIKTFRWVELGLIFCLSTIGFIFICYETYQHQATILKTIEPVELRRISPRYDWLINGFWPLFIEYFLRCAILILTARLIIPKLLEQNYKAVIGYSLSILAIIILSRIYFLSYWRDIDFRYMVDWCIDVENNRYWSDKAIIGAKVRSPFRWLNVLISSQYQIINLALYILISGAYQWAIIKPAEERNINHKIILEGSGLSLIFYFLFWLDKFSFYTFPFWVNLLVITTIFLHSYLFYHNLVRIPLKNERSTFFNLWKTGLIITILALFIFELTIGINTLSNSYKYVYYYYLRSFQFRIEEVLENIIIVMGWSIATVFVRNLIVRPFALKLGRKQAELANLQSQINPHFLFNALNTLYASALNEKAIETGGGIQKLSDMMRFTLHENNKLAIDIRQEVTYLRNYIDLQKLRTAGHNDFELTVNLDDSLCLKSIAPMLLIPFVENAFKHGISMRHKSWISIDLHCSAKALSFRVFNSIHAQSADDPEREASGIGLENVKKRLALIYPKKHKLSIHQTQREFSVSLEIEI